MSVVTTESISGPGFRIPASTDVSGGAVFSSASTAFVYDDAQLLAASQPSDPIARVTALTVPASWTIPADWLGMVGHRWPIGPSDPPDVPTYVARSHDFYLNPKSLRWHHLETSAGVWDWSLFDQWINAHKAAARDIIITLGFTPSFYAGTTQAYAVGKEAYGTGTGAPPSDMAKWRDYVQAVVNRCTFLGVPYNKLVLEVWNEPHFAGGFSKYYYAGTAAELALMGRITWNVAKAVSSSIRIAVGAISKIEATGQGEMIAILDASAAGLDVGGDAGAGKTGADYCDLLSIHTYTTADTRGFDYGGSIFGNMGAMRTLRDARPAITAKPIWCTEAGYIDGAKASDDVRGLRIVRLLLASICSGSSKVLLHSWDNNEGMGIYDLPVYRQRLRDMYSAITGKTVSRANWHKDGRIAVVFSDGSSYVI